MTFQEQEVPGLPSQMSITKNLPLLAFHSRGVGTGICGWPCPFPPEKLCSPAASAKFGVWEIPRWITSRNDPEILFLFLIGLSLNSTHIRRFEGARLGSHSSNRKSKHTSHKRLLTRHFAGCSAGFISQNDNRSTDNIDIFTTV